MGQEIIEKIMTLYDAELQKQKMLYAAIANMAQAGIDQSNLKSIALLALLREQKQEQPEVKQSKEQEKKSK